ncbi:hypothetical protein GWC77_13465 [Paraburkholderia sp. NMBU_R16]|uniref:hypothetical protein n=1 Tax=Paraburkholderia sp. NMBU_R16 TaxID=2698676 RepID=UPI001563571B|nr:hypothetical protein [Paraburkholderia sp. NMBU_R16]NRO96929.1 hypothetical protein [Paraburkholderia sp. NMBU_R16]
MLTPHEIALLFVATDAPERVDIDDSNVASLVARELIDIEHTGGGRGRPVLTLLGARTVARLRDTGSFAAPEPGAGR